VSGDEGADGSPPITLYPSLRGKRVFATGGGSGIDADIVRAYALQGALVAFADSDITASTALLAHVVQQGGAQPGASLKLSKETTS
jgi:NAD(P)-dependent dehydrogenase (short-subunit alcohol dehydrogenase family)